VTADVTAARSDWEQGYLRLLDAARDPTLADRLHAQMEAVTAELRKRVGGTYTLRELVQAYAGSESWMREAVAEHAATPGWPRTLAVAGDAAFHLYARGAAD
jgi:hypothetical protein